MIAFVLSTAGALLGLAVFVVLILTVCVVTENQLLERERRRWVTDNRRCRSCIGPPGSHHEECQAQH